MKEIEAAIEALEMLEPYVEGFVDYSATAAEWPMNNAPRKLHAALAGLRSLKQEPVARLPSAEWTACVKLPVTVHVRQQRPGENHVSTREGITPVKPDDLIMRGVSGEEYPIGREIFERTYRIGEYHPAPVNQQLLEALKRIVGADGLFSEPASGQHAREIARAAIAQAEGMK